MKQADIATNNNADAPKGNSAKDIKTTKEYEAVRDMARDFASKDYAELSDIKQDLDSLRDNVVQLTRHLKKDGAHKADEMKERVKEGFDTLRHKGEDGLKVVEDKVRANPRNGVLLAFAAGVLANVLLRRS